MGSLVLTVRDGQVSPRQTATAKFYHADLAGDITATIALQNALRDAVKGISWGQVIKTARLVSEAHHIDVPAGHVDADANTDAMARREGKWLVRYHDSVTGEKGTMTVPCANMTLLDATGALLDTTAATPGAQFVSDFEALVIGPSGNSAVFDEAIFVGRNL